MKKLSLFIGPVLFLTAQVILPEGSAETATRGSIIASNLFAWELGHLLIALAFVFLVLWLMDIYAQVRAGGEWLAWLGLFFGVLALIADYGIGLLQLQSADLVERGLEQWALPVMEFNKQNQNLLLLAYLPTLGFVPSFGLLALAFYRRSQQILPALLLAAAGLMVAVAGLLQIKLLFVLGALTLLAFTVLLVRADLGINHD